MISGPIRQSSFNIREFALGLFDWRAAAVFREEIFVLLPQDFGDSAVSFVSMA